MAVSTAISDIFHSIYELFASVLGAIYSIVNSAFSAMAGFLSGIANLIGNIFSGIINMAGGVGKFVAGNFFILVIGAIGAVAYMRYTAQGRRVATNKKIN